MVERGDALGDPRRVIDGCRDVDDRVPDVQARRARRDEAQEDLRSGLVRVVLEEVVLGRPVVLETDRVDRDRDVDLAQEALVLVLARRTCIWEKIPNSIACLPFARGARASGVSDGPAIR